MATTDTKTGFRLPWGSNQTDHGAAAEPPADVAADGAAHDDAADALAESQQETETPPMIDAAAAPQTHDAIAEAVASDAPTAPDASAGQEVEPSPTPSTPRKFNKFLADLTKAMQAAAESARAETLERMGTEAKSCIESIHAASSDEATELRRKADDDVAAVREWSKAEIARIREETDERITHRKEQLEQEIERHAAAIEARIERVQGRVARFEAEMDAFFERLLAEDDPTHFAAMAESIPEPPPFDSEDDDVEPVAELEPVSDVDPVATTEAIEPSSAFEWGTSVEAVEAVEAVETESTPADANANANAEDDTTSARVELAADDTDPRLSVLGLTPDFAAAEAEAAASMPMDDGSDDEVPEIADETIAARIAGLVPETDFGAPASVSTRVDVTGLVSVASIAGFKRHLSRVPGVQSVGVSSGPDGAFSFSVTHDPSVAMRDVVPTLPGFSARVTADDEGGLTVAAQDPESES